MNCQKQANDRSVFANLVVPAVAMFIGIGEAKAQTNQPPAGRSESSPGYRIDNGDPSRLVAGHMPSASNLAPSKSYEEKSGEGVAAQGDVQAAPVTSNAPVMGPGYQPSAWPGLVFTPLAIAAVWLFRPKNAPGKR